MVTFQITIKFFSKFQHLDFRNILFHDDIFSGSTNKIMEFGKPLQMGLRFTRSPNPDHVRRKNTINQKNMIKNYNQSKSAVLWHF